MSPRIGLFGGTFDPPHIGHLILAAEARFQLRLDKLLWILTPDPPHKQNLTITPLQHRLEMVRLALEDSPEFELSTIEIDRPGPHFALDTINILARQEPGAELIYLMGGDSLRDLPTWHTPKELLAALDLIGVMRRPGDAIDLPALENNIPGLTDKTMFVEAPLIDISAHDIRLRISEGHPYRFFLPANVYHYIKVHNIYQNPDD